MEAEGAPADGRGSRKKALLLFLKRQPGSTLAEIARALGISKVVALRHASDLERDGLVARSTRAEGRGRPPVRFALRPEAARLFPEAYSGMSLFALEFVERELGRESVVRLLQQRTNEVAERHRRRFRGKDLGAKVRELAMVRQEGGYMAEEGPRRRSTFELREFNCPILALADRFPEACSVERRMFEQLLAAEVETTHRVVAGDPVCRFLIRPQPSAEGTDTR